MSAITAAGLPRARASLFHGLDYKWQVLSVVSVGTFMVVLDTTIVNIALPRIIAVFSATVDQAQLVLTGYMVALAIMMPTTAYLSATFGAKRVYLTTLVLFTMGSMLCGAAWSLPMLVVARVLQGLGGSMIQPLGMAMIFQNTPENQRGAVVGVYAMPVMVAPILGPTLGGYLTEYVDWRWVFYVNLPAGILGVVLGMMLLRETPRQTGLKLDWVGLILAALCTCPALLAAADAPDKGWGDPGVMGKLVVSAVALPVFVWWELTVRQPLVELRLFRTRAFTVGALVNLVTSASLFGAMFLLPLFLQNLRGLGAMETGLLLFPQAIASMAAALAVGRLYDRIGPRPLIVLGLGMMATSTWLLSRIDLGTSDSSLQAALLLRGFGMMVAMMPAMTAWQSAAPRHLMAAASALNNVVRQIYAAFTTAGFATLISARSDFHYEALRAFITPDSPAARQVLGQAQQFALAHGQSLLHARASAVAQIFGQVTLSATVRSFDDCFLLASLLCVVGILPALFTRRATGGVAVPAE